MNRSLWISATGMECQQIMTNTIANNMANVNTTGYKRSVAHFQDLLYQRLSSPGAATADAESSVGVEMGSGVRTISVNKHFTQGDVQNTSSPLDLAIEGDGFFEILLPDGSSAYSRDGAFHLNASGQVVTAEGYTVSGFPTIGTDTNEITIMKDGTVSVTSSNDTTNAGRITLARFVNNEGLRSLGGNLYSATDASGAATRGNPGGDGYGALAQYHLEGSNVEIVKEMVSMIASQRAYELNSKSIRTADEMLRLVANLK